VVAQDGGLAPRGDTVSGARVDRVVDGDTVHVLVDGDDVTVRLIGINTPETVKPDSPVECFGPESSEFAKQALSGRTVTLEFDDSQGLTDQFDRTLAYVWVEEENGGLTLFNLEAVAGGYAYERQYGSTPYAWRDEFSAAQRSARSSESGLWGACPP
jgi:micrococcal nuclease